MAQVQHLEGAFQVLGHFADIVGRVAVVLFTPGREGGKSALCPIQPPAIMGHIFQRLGLTLRKGGKFRRFGQSDQRGDLFGQIGERALFFRFNEG